MKIIGNDQKNNGQNFWEILERVIGKISSVIGAGLPALPIKFTHYTSFILILKPIIPIFFFFH